MTTNIVNTLKPHGFENKLENMIRYSKSRLVSFD